MSTLSPKQLAMVTDRDSIRNLPEVPLPLGYVIRDYRLGDENSWADTLRTCGFEKWNDVEVLAYLEDTERRVGSRVVDHNGKVVAATFASRKPEDASNTVASAGIGSSHEEGILDFVVTHPDHRGKKLARATCTEVAKFFVDRGCSSVSLQTDDWRLPAIHVYLSLGFKPVMHRSDMPDRWANVFNNLKEAGHDHS